MKMYREMDPSELMSIYEDLLQHYHNLKAQALKLDMSRGKIDNQQVLLSFDMLDVINSHYDFQNHLDYCNYGCLEGIPEAKNFFADILNTDANNIIVYGNSSLNIMFDQISRAYTHGYDNETPWSQLKTVKFLCPVPGYDRHFAITEHFGIEMIPIPINENGPDMDLIQQYVENDQSVKGIWCVPQYANPTGITYSDDVVKRFAQLNPAAKDFRIFWDNAYVAHHLYSDQQEHVSDILSACQDAGHPDLAFVFCSTSKITFPGSGVAALATSQHNKEAILKHMSFQLIGHDKLNQLRHITYFQNIESLDMHMQKHADLLRPKFETVLSILSQELEPLGIAEWTKPLGGYFISFNAMEGCAKSIVKKCQEAGVVLTAAGATFPYGKDPLDQNIRLAPSFPTLDELKQAAQLFVLCVKLSSLEKILERHPHE